MRNPAATPQLAEIAAVEKLRLSLHTLDVDDSASVQQAVDEITGQAVRYVPASAAASVMNSPRAIAAQNVCTTSVTIRSENLAIATSDQPPPKVDETHEPQDPPAQQPRSAPIAAARVAGAVARPGSHRTVRTLVVYGSSGRRVMTPAAGRFATSKSSP